MATETKAVQTLNADELELQKFGELAHKWWDKNSEFKPLHEINPLRLDYIDNLVSLKNKRVLDVGCGGGILSEAMYFKGASVMGIDLGVKALNVAKLHQLESGSKVIADEAYLTESIKDPKAKVVKGFQPTMPIYPFTDEEIANIVAYIKTLK